MRFPIALLLAILACAVVPSVAAAQAPATDADARARELYDNGSLLYEEGRYEDAVAAWQEAYDLSERPLLLFNIANALERLGRLQEALDSLNAYRAFAPADERETLQRRITNLERRLRDQRDAEAGRSAIEVHQLETRTIAPASTGPHPAGIGLLVGGLGAAGAGGGLAGAALATRTQARQHCVQLEAGWTCAEAAQPLLARDRTLSAVSDGLWIGGAVAATGGLIVSLVTAGTGASAAVDRPADRRVVVAPLLGEVLGIQVGGVF